MKNQLKNTTRRYVITHCHIQLFRCEKCIHDQFQKNSELKCKKCNTVHKNKEEFSSKSMEETYYEEDNKYRKEVFEIMYKTVEELGGNTEVYNKLLEEIEDTSITR